MYLVSDSYSEAMRQPIRQCETGARVYIGVFDTTALDDGDLLPASGVFYSSLEPVLQGGAKGEYATFEPGFFRLDGSQILLPGETAALQTQGWISESVSGADGAFPTDTGLTVMFGSAHDLPGLTVTFGQLEEDIPGRLRVSGWRDGQRIAQQEYTAADLQPTSRLELAMEQVNEVRLEALASQNPAGRARVARVEFGLGYSFSHKEILRITEKHEESPVSLSLPTGSLSFVLDNSDGRFDVDRKDSLVNFLRQGNRVEVEYLVTAAGSQQRIPSRGWKLSSWNAKGVEAAFEAKDALAALGDTQYEKGQFHPEQYGIGQTAREVLEDAGAQAYQVDSLLGDMQLPVPVVSHAQALQLLANLARARLYVNREGSIVLARTNPGSDFQAGADTGQLTAYSDPNYLDLDCVEAATFEPGFFRLDRRQHLLPKTEFTGRNGIATAAQAGEDGWFASPPEVYFTAREHSDVWALTLDFGSQPAARIGISTQENQQWSEERVFAIQSGRMTLRLQAQHVSGIRLRFLQARQQGQRGHLIGFSVDTDMAFSLDQDQIYQDSTASLEPRLQCVTALCTDPVVTAETEQLASLDFNTASGTVSVSHRLGYQVEAVVEPSVYQVQLTSWAYRSKITGRTGTSHQLKVTLQGKKVNLNQISLTSPAAKDGEVLELDNPLLDIGSGQQVLNWVQDYYSRRAVRRLHIRGFPEIDCGDTVEYLNGKRGLVTATQLTYNGAFDQVLTVRGE